MKSLDFKESNVKLGKPRSMTDEECSSLDIFTDQQVCISCWAPSFWERIKLLFTGRIWLCVLSGHTQPPVWLSANYPFVEPEKK